MEVLRCLPASAFEGPSELVAAAKAGAVGDPVCFPKASRYRFVTYRAALLNDQRMRHYIQTITSAPVLEIVETAPTQGE